MQQTEAWLTLAHIDKLRPATLLKLISRFKSPKNILQASQIELQSLGINRAIIEGIRSPKENALHCDLAWLEHENHHLLTIQDPAYPTLLKQISDPPSILYVLGKPKLAANLLADSSKLIPKKS